MAKKKSRIIPKWKSFEESAAQASSKIFSNETVKANQKVMGTISQVFRQIDIKVGDDEFIDVECKDHGAPVDLPIVEQFANKMKDENAKSGIIVSNSGFTESALRTAEHYGIKPVALIDKGFGDTSKFVIKAPIVASAFYLDSISYGIGSTGQDFRFSPLVWDMKVGDGSGRNIYEFFRDQWNDGKLEITQEGHFQYAFDKVPIIDLRSDVIIVDLAYRYVVKADKRKGYAGAKTARGFYDMNAGSFTSSETIEFEPIEMVKINDWPEVEESDNLPDQPFEMIGLAPLPEEPPLSSYESPFTGKMLDPERVSKGIYL